MASLAMTVSCRVGLRPTATPVCHCERQAWQSFDLNRVRLSENSLSLRAVRRSNLLI
ncbi:MAG: hypothetical protein J6U05_02030 [Neisseriaceae bacterium]|nr:hypothetical protein [Neisseriaceae bacterium]